MRLRLPVAADHSQPLAADRFPAFPRALVSLQSCDQHINGEPIREIELVRMLPDGALGIAEMWRRFAMG